MAGSNVGIWLIGGRGSVATTVAVGLSALQRNQAGNVGLVTALPVFARLDLVAWDELVLGGHEIRDVCLADEAARMHRESGVFDADLLAACRSDLETTDSRIRFGTRFNCGAAIERLGTESPTPAEKSPDKSPRAIVERLQADLESFAADNALDRLVVVNVASTEPAVAVETVPSGWSDLERTLDSSASCPLPASSLYAIAALDLGHAYVNFTPSLGASPPAINGLARDRGTCHAGCDGKTGETLLKSVLAPMFSQRNLEVMSWVGHNIFGNLDGRILNDPANKAAKVASKDQLLGRILGYQPATHVSIEYIESLADWKTAWDHIHFRGFLGTPMSLQLTWQGCDSLLAAPLVMDLVRFVDLAGRRGETGPLGFLASFFKSPLGAVDDDFASQFAELIRWADPPIRKRAISD